MDEMAQQAVEPIERGKAAAGASGGAVRLVDAGFSGRRTATLEAHIEANMSASSAAQEAGYLARAFAAHVASHIAVVGIVCLIEQDGAARAVVARDNCDLASDGGLLAAVAHIVVAAGALIESLRGPICAAMTEIAGIESPRCCRGTMSQRVPCGADGQSRPSSSRMRR